MFLSLGVAVRIGASAFAFAVLTRAFNVCRLWTLNVVYCANKHRSISVKLGGSYDRNSKYLPSCIHNVGGINFPVKVIKN